MGDLYEKLESVLLSSDESDSDTAEVCLLALCVFAKETGVDLAYIIAEALKRTTEVL